jgi:hypothetical protein
MAITGLVVLPFLMVVEFANARSPLTTPIAGHGRKQKLTRLHDTRMVNSNGFVLLTKHLPALGRSIPLLCFKWRGSSLPISIIALLWDFCMRIRNDQDKDPHRQIVFATCI